MGQNATHDAHSAHTRAPARGTFRYFVGSWYFAPVVLTCLLCLVLVAFAYRMQMRESKELHAVFENHLQLVTRVVEVSAEHALRDGHHRDLRGILSSVESHDRDLDVMVVDLEGGLLFASEEDHRLSEEERRIVAQTFDTRRGISIAVGSGLERSAVRSALLNADDMDDAVLVVRRSMRDLEADLAGTRAHALYTAVALALISLIFGLALAHLRVREPLRKLRAMIEGLADVERDLVLATQGPGGDRSENEVRALVRAFEELMQRLGRARATSEADSRRRQGLASHLADSAGRAKLLQFSYELAHEIGSPLQVILGRATMLESRAERPDEVRRHAKIVVDETQRIQRIVERSLQDTLEPRSGLATIDLAARSRELAELHRDPPGLREVPYLLQLPDHPVPIRMDPDALDQILRNVIANAHEACDQEGEVRIALDHAPGHAVLRVRDTGRGMSDELLERASRPFFSTRANARGHGLGLPIVQRLSRENGVLFEIDSEDGVGTTVTLTFDDARVEGRLARHDAPTHRL